MKRLSMTVSIGLFVAAMAAPLHDRSDALRSCTRAIATQRLPGARRALVRRGSLPAMLD